MTPILQVCNIMAASMLQRLQVLSIVKTSVFKKKIHRIFAFKVKRIYESLKMSLDSPVAAAAEPAGRDRVLVTVTSKNNKRCEL